GLGQVDIGSGLFARRLGRLEIGAPVQGNPVKLGPGLCNFRERQVAHRFELLRQALLADSRAQGDSRAAEGLTGVRGIALEGEALDLDAEELETGDVASLGPEAVQALELV